MLSRLRRFLLRMVGSQELRPADAVVVAALISLPLASLNLAIRYYQLTHPESTPFLDLELLAAVVPIHALGPAFALVLLVTGLVARKRWPDGQLLAHVAAQFFVVSLALYSYLLGHYTSLLGAMVLITGAAAGGLLFDPRVVRWALTSFVAIVVITTVGERMGVLPDAPLISELSVKDRLPDAIFLQHAFHLSILVAVAFFFVEAMQVNRERERRLRRATALIRRYVPAQLAERILSGQYTQGRGPERRRLTLFFSDVVGFTAAADEMEPEDLAALLNDYLAEMSRIAEAHGATINQFVGDGIMIFFGAPEASDDREGALRCVRMALAMQRRMTELGEKWFRDGVRVPFRVRVGINTGVASVGDFGSEGRRTYSAIGNQTNLAARIQQVCEPGKVLVSHTTWSLIKDEIPCQGRGEIEVKGLHYPVRVYEVMEEAGATASTAGSSLT